MARNNLLLGSVLATALLTAACGTSASGTASTTPSSASSSSAASSPESVAESSADDTTTSAPDGSVAAADLDAETIAWFTTLCGGLTSVMDAAGSMGSMQVDQSSPAAYQAALAATFTQFADGFSGTADALSELPPPTFEGGEQVSTTFITGLSAVGDALAAEVEKFAAAPVTDLASVEAAAAALGTGFTSSMTEIGTAMQGIDDSVPADVKAAVEALPECAVLGAGE